MSNPMPYSRLRLCIPLVAAMSLGACAARSLDDASETDSPRGRMITAAEIQKTGASTAWEALKFTVRSHYFREYRGQPVRVSSNRGQGSLTLIEEPQVYIDGARVGEITVLRYIPAHIIDNIRILGSADGTTYYGTNAAAGVILIETGMGLDPFFDVDTIPAVDSIPSDTTATRRRKNTANR